MAAALLWALSDTDCSITLEVATNRLVRPGSKLAERRIRLRRVTFTFGKRGMKWPHTTAGAILAGYENHFLTRPSHGFHSCVAHRDSVARHRRAVAAESAAVQRRSELAANPEQLGSRRSDIDFRRPKR